MAGTTERDGFHGNVETYQPIVLGVLFCLGVAIAALFIGSWFGVPALLLALLLGMALRRLAVNWKPGIDFTSKRLVELGVALLGFKVSLAVLQTASLESLALLALGIAATMAGSVLLAPLFTVSRSTGLLVGAATAICGSSACMTIGSLLPRSKETDRSITLVIVATTLLSSVAMVAYPMLLHAFDLPDEMAGIILGGSIQNVPQAIGAGLAYSDTAGQTAAVTKLLRVAMLVPVALICLAILTKTAASRDTEERSFWRFIPWFIPVFLILLAINSSGILPSAASSSLAELSELSLMTGIAAIGVKTPFNGLLDEGWGPLVLTIAAAAFLLLFIGLGVTHV